MYQSTASAQAAQAALAIKSDAPTIEIQHYAPAGAGLARFVARVVHTAASRANPALVAQAFRNKFNGQLQAVAGSVKVVDRGPISDIMTGIASVVREVVAIGSPDDMKGFKAVASNMFLDEEDRMWTLNKTESGSLMVRTTGIDDDQALVGMLHAVASSAPSASAARELQAVASDVLRSVEAGKYVTYVNANNEVAHGFVVVCSAEEGDTTALVLAPGAEDVEQIDTHAVIEVADVPDDTLPELTDDENLQISIASARGAVNLEMMVSYYKRVFGHNPEFFKQFEANLRKHAFC